MSADEVTIDGRVHYAPYLACRPKRPQDYPPDRLRAWNEVRARVGRDPIIYSRSVDRICEECEITVTVGPMQQDAEQRAREFGLDVHVICLLCAAEIDAAEVEVQCLGNPEDADR